MLCIKGLKMNVSYEFIDGEVVELNDNKIVSTWSIYTVPDSVLRRVLSWNDKDGDFDECDRIALLQVFLADFVMTRGK